MLNSSLSSFFSLLLVIADNVVNITGYVNVGSCRVSPDNNYLAYTLDISGGERFTLQIKDLRSGLIDPKLEVYGAVSLAWAQDASYLFYTLSDENQRPYRQNLTIGFSFCHFSGLGKGMGFSLRCHPNCRMILCQGSLQKTWIWSWGWSRSIYWKQFQFLCGHNKHKRRQIHNREFKLKNFIRGRNLLVLLYEYIMKLLFSSDMLILMLITGLCYRFGQSIKWFTENM